MPGDVSQKLGREANQWQGHRGTTTRRACIVAVRFEAPALGGRQHGPISRPSPCSLDAGDPDHSSGVHRRAERGWVSASARRRHWDRSQSADMGRSALSSPHYFGLDNVTVLVSVRSFTSLKSWVLDSDEVSARVPGGARPGARSGWP